MGIESGWMAARCIEGDGPPRDGAGVAAATDAHRFSGSRYAAFETGAPEAEAFLSALHERTRGRLNEIAAVGESVEACVNVFRAGASYESRGPYRDYGERRFALLRRPGWTRSALSIRDRATDALLRIVEPGAFGLGDMVEFGAWEPDDEGRRVAFTVFRDGGDEGEIRVFDVEAARVAPDRLAGVRFGRIAWAPDGRSFLYNTYPRQRDAPGGVDPRRLSAVYRHRLGDDPGHDDIVYANFATLDEIALPRRLRHTPIWLIDVLRGSERGNRLLLSVGADAVAWSPLPAAAATRLHVFGGRMRDGAVELIATSVGAAANGEVRRITATPGANGPGFLERVIIAETDAPIHRAELAGDRIALAYRSMEDGCRLRLFDCDGRAVARRDFGTGVEVTIFVPDPSRRALAALRSTRAQDPELLEIDLATAAARVIRRSSSALSTPDATRRLLHVNSARGLRVPLSLIHRDGLALSKARACLLVGYGGFGRDLDFGFDPLAALIVQRGGVVALAHVRGGSERGASWHDAGRKAGRLDAVTDFIRCAEALIEQGVTTERRLIAHGASNGGLLVAATMARRPSLFAGVICESPVIDMLRFDRNATGALWRAEFGDPADAGDREHLTALSPIDSLPSAPHGHILIVSSQDDERVPAWHAAKYAAALTFDGPSPANVWYLRRVGGGHRNAIDGDALARHRADLFAWFCRVAGLTQV